MTEISSASHPTFTYKIDPLLNISPLIDLYSQCLTHVVDTDGFFQLPAHKNPVFVSHKRGILKSSLSYQPVFARVRFPRCLLTIAAAFFSWNYCQKTLRKYIIAKTFDYYLTPTDPTSKFASIFPRVFIILTNQHANHRIYCYDDRPLFFSLQLKDGLHRSPGFYGVLSHELSNRIAFNCSSFGSCRNKIEHSITIFGKIFQDSWFYGGGIVRGNPFSRAAKVGIQTAMNSFILQSKNQRNEMNCCPKFSVSSFFAFPRSAQIEVLQVGTTPTVKFATTTGVFTPKLTYYVFFSPFLPMVWFGIVVCAAISLVAVTGTYRMQTQKADLGLLSLIVEIATWILAVAIGQYKHSAIPLISGHLRREPIRVVLPVIVAWFILSTFLLNVYSAVFNADATRSFYYETNYTRILQLPFQISTYVLVNESYVSGNQDSCAVSYYSVCSYANIKPAVCVIEDSIYMESAQKFEKLKYMKMTKESSVKAMIQQQHLQDEISKLNRFHDTISYVRANTECLSQLILQSKNPLVFLIHSLDFQKYWQLFVQVMEVNPSVKAANNFASDDSLLSRTIVFSATGGLHPALKGSVVTRMKILLSSGIYGLWEKWRYRIKFSDGGLQHDEKKLPKQTKVDPLSFDNSGVPWIFQAQAIAWLAATVILLVELITQFLPVVRFGVIAD